MQGPVHEYDVIGHPKANFHFSVTFPFHSAPSGRWRDGEVTVLKEYCQGTNEMAYCLPTGAFDPRKHADNEACARAELSEEVRDLPPPPLPPLPQENHRAAVRSPPLRVYCAGTPDGR
jgi:hypothetical protein